MTPVAISIIAAAAWAISANFPAHAETINVYDDHGGIVPEYDARWAALAARGVDVRIVAPRWRAPRASANVSWLGST